MSEYKGSEEWTRLQGLYGDMADEELVGLAAAPEDLTPAAREVLMGEVGRRGLEVVPAAVAQPGEQGAVRRVGSQGLAEGTPTAELRTFYDALDARRACDFLEEAAIPFEIEDMGERSALGSLEGVPPVALRVFVSDEDFARARDVLRREMGLFPKQEVEVADEMVDDGTRTPVGFFRTHGEAAEVAGLLSAAGFWNAVVMDAEADEEARFSVEVREVDLFAAGDALEKALEG